MEYNKCKYNKCKYTKCFRTTNLVAYVDARKGNNKKAQLSSINCPFKTINNVINLILLKANEFNKPISIKHRWTIIVNPGIYNEKVILPGFIDLIGVNKMTVFIDSLLVTGSSLISGITINGKTLPLINTLLDSNDENLNKVNIEDIIINVKEITNFNGSPAGIIESSGVGINNEIIFSNSVITVDYSSASPTDQIIINNSADITLKNINVNALFNFKNKINVIVNNQGQIIINDSNFTIEVNDGPEEEVNLFSTINGGSTTVNNTNSIIAILVIANPYKNDVNYTKLISASTFTNTNSTAYLDGVSSDHLNLVLIDEFSNASILSTNIYGPLDEIPKIKGYPVNVKYELASGVGDIVSNGGFWSNINKVNINSPNVSGGAYFVQGNDMTILAEDVNVNIFDPSLAASNIIIKGKILFIRNISNINIQINFENDKIFGGISPINLASNSGIMLQADDTLWYVILD